MSEQDSSAPARRPRPTYGLPGPSAGTGDAAAEGPHTAAPASAAGSASDTRSAYDAGSASAHHGASAPTGAAAPRSAGASSPAPAAGWSLPSSPAPQPTQKRRGVVPLILGLVLLLVIAPVLAVGGFVFSMREAAGSLGSGPVVMQGGSAQVDLAANEMVLVLVPEADAGTAECSIGDAGPSVTSIPSSGQVPLDAGTYEQKLGVAAVDDTQVTITCEGTTADPVYVGPMSMSSIGAPLLIGLVGGLVAGLAGVILLVIGIVLFRRSRR